MHYDPFEFLDPASNTKMREFIKAEFVKYAEIVKKIGLEPQ